MEYTSIIIKTGMETQNNMNHKYTDAVKIAQFLYKQSSGITKVFHRNDIIDAAKALEIKPAVAYKFIITDEFRQKRGMYSITYLLENETQPSKPVKTEQPKAAPDKTVNLQSQGEIESITYVPQIDSSYVRWGSFSDLRDIVKSEAFFPVYIFGPSGNGKTMMVEQACALAKRNYIRVNISPETCEDDLIGGWRLKDGNTVFEKGPVIKAMEDGAVLLLDELDRSGSGNKLLCLQSILEGKSILLKKTGETVHPSPGFNVIATANTAGRGSEDGKYSGAAVIDDAFLERFPIAIDQPWPSKAVERKILLKAMEVHDCVDEEFADKLVTWSKIIRATYDSGGIDEVISTRRLTHVVQTNSIFKNRVKSIALVVSRFPTEVREAFTDLYTKIDEGALVDPDEAPPQVNENGELRDDVPF